MCFYGRQIGVCTWLSTSRRYLGEHIASPSILPAFMSRSQTVPVLSSFSAPRDSAEMCFLRVPRDRIRRSPSISPTFDAGVYFVNCFRISSGCVFLFRARVVMLAFIFFFIFCRLTIGSHVVHCPACHAVINYVPFKEHKLLFILHFCRIFAATLPPAGTYLRCRPVEPVSLER